MISKKDFKKLNDYLWEIPRSFRHDMRVPARIYLSERMLESTFQDRSVGQLINIATLPGIVNYSLAMPDIHEGYGFPIGGVAAMNMTDGVISPGGVGYDINCLHPDSLISLPFASYLKIGELKNSWTNKKVALLQKDFKKLTEAQIIYSLSRKENNFLFSLRTKSGFVLKVTGDHPIFTPEGMKETRLLKEGDKVTIYPFKGVHYQEPLDEIILSENDFKKALLKLGKTTKGAALQQTMNFIRKLSLLPLRYNSRQTPYLLKLMGYVFGDGSISFVGKAKKGTVWFYGEPDDLETIRQDIKKLGFTPSKIYKRTRNHRIKTHYKEYKFIRTEYSIKVVSSTFASLLVALGVPFGFKTCQKYKIPKWIFKCPLWQKRLFLASFFGAEMSKPTTLNKYNFYAPSLNINKTIPLKENGFQFLTEIKGLLKEFEIDCSEIVEVEGLSNPGKTIGLRIRVKSISSNLLKFFETIGFEYHQEKQKLACLAIAYLRTKERTVTLRSNVRELVKALYHQGIPSKVLVKNYQGEFINEHFIEHSVWSNRGKPRIAFNFLSFKEFIKAHQYGSEGLMIDEIEEIKKEKYKGLVYDFTIGHPDHNFIANNFVVSNCGVRLLKSEHSEEEIRPHLNRLATEIQNQVPSGLGKGRKIKLSIDQVSKILEQGIPFLVKKGYGTNEDVENCESEGRLEQADASTVSDKAKNRGRGQVGTLGSGNHFMEIQKVEEIFDEKVAETFGLFKDQVVIMIHTGSRGLGHQIATDYIKTMMQAMAKYEIRLPDRELAACPINSFEGKNYLAAMAAGANYAWSNRHMISHYVREAWKKILGEKEKLELLYDVAHNIAKIEEHEVNGEKMKLIVHRKGATRAFPPGHPEVPERYRKVGQPVLIPGTMGTASYVLVGTEKSKEAWYTVCHGAGRTMSRRAATRKFPGNEVVRDLEAKGIIVKCHSFRGIAEEAPLAYKDVDNVVEIVDKAGLAKKVAKLVPLAVIKGE